MKISRRFSYIIGGILLLANIPVVQAQPAMVTKLQTTFTSYWKQLKDFKNCVTGRKVCSSRERAVKTATLIGGGLVVLSALMVLVPRMPNIIQKHIDIEKLKRENENIFGKYNQLLPEVVAFQKESSEIKFNDAIMQFRALETNDEFRRIDEELEAIEKRNPVEVKLRQAELKNVQSQLKDISNLLKWVRDIIKKK